MTQLPTRQQVDRAEPLEFAERSARQELTITIHATIDGFSTEICFRGALDQLEAITRRLRDLGASPAGVHQLAPAAAAPARKAAQRATPAYDGDGQPMCPVHRKPLSEGRFGLFCPAKAKPGEEQNDKGYCSLRFAE
jgi:hypothetical protein